MLAHEGSLGRVHSWVFFAPEAAFNQPEPLLGADDVDCVCLRPRRFAALNDSTTRSSGQWITTHSLNYENPNVLTNRSPQLFLETADFSPLLSLFWFFQNDGFGLLFCFPCALFFFTCLPFASNLSLIIFWLRACDFGVYLWSLPYFQRLSVLENGFAACASYLSLGQWFWALSSKSLLVPTSFAFVRVSMFGELLQCSCNARIGFWFFGRKRIVGRVFSDFVCFISFSPASRLCLTDEFVFVASNWKWNGLCLLM